MSLIDTLEGVLTSNIKIGPKFVRIALNAIDTADALYSPDEERAAYEDARAEVLAKADAHDIKWLPDAIEEPLERFAINIAFDVLWQATHSQRLRAMLVKAAS